MYIVGRLEQDKGGLEYVFMEVERMGWCKLKWSTKCGIYRQKRGGWMTQNGGKRETKIDYKHSVSDGSVSDW